MSDRLVVKDPESWDRVTREARAQVTAELQVLEQMPLEFGQLIAWATTAKVGKATDEFSSVHRVGAPIGNAAHTTCGTPIPEPAMWVPLSAALAKALLPCGFCEHAMRRHDTGMAA